jgi:hypothetical protein
VNKESTEMGVGYFRTIPYSIPVYPVDLKLANQCYLLIHTADDLKRSPMSIVLDLGGNSSDRKLVGQLIHVAANENDGLHPHGVTLSHHLWEFRRETVKIIWIGHLLDSKYRTGNTALPHYFLSSCVCVDNEQLTTWQCFPSDLSRCNQLVTLCYLMY